MIYEVEDEVRWLVSLYEHVIPNSTLQGLLLANEAARVIL